MSLLLSVSKRASPGHGSSVTPKDCLGRSMYPGPSPQRGSGVGVDLWPVERLQQTEVCHPPGDLSGKLTNLPQTTHLQGSSEVAGKHGLITQTIVSGSVKFSSIIIRDRRQQSVERP